MKKFILPLAAVAAMAAAAPAYADHDRHNQARYYGAPAGGSWVRSIEARADALARAVQQARHAGHLDSYTANSIMGQLNATVNVAHQYRRGGVTRKEADAIENRFAKQEYRLRTGGHYDNRNRYSRSSGYRW